MSDKNKQERTFKAYQLYSPGCLNRWTRLRLPTNEGIWFWPDDLGRQASDQQVRGYILAEDFTSTNCQNCLVQWVQLTLRTGKTILFFPIRYSGNLIHGWIWTAQYSSAICSPFPVIPNVADTKYGRMPLQQTGYGYLITGTYTYNSTRGEITYGTLWGNELYGQWRQGSSIGRFRWVISSDARSFDGTFGSGDNFSGGGTWWGRKIQ